MNLHSPEFYQLIARYLTGESTDEESVRLETMLATNPELIADFELCKSILLDGCVDSEKGPDAKKHFERISRRLKDEGLM